MTENVRTKIKDGRKAMVSRFLERMQDGIMPWQCPWAVEALHPQNPYTNIIYRGGNRLRLWDAIFEENYTDPRWMTYNQIQGAGFRLKDAKGKGVLLEHWRYTEIRKTENEKGEKIREEVPLRKPVPGYFYVFNGKHIEGLPPLDKAEQHLSDLGEKLRASSECPIKERAIGRAFYDPSSDEINLPARYAFAHEEEFYAVMLHEMAHATGHPSRLNRPLMVDMESESYGKEELRAELGSAFLRAELGIPMDEYAYQQSGAYISSWLSLLENDPDELLRAAADAELICDRIMQRYQQQLEIQEETEVEALVQGM